jgi:Fur family ferric uptake transcriptional regulator
VASELVRDRLLAAGERISPQRDVIAGVLEATARPLGAAELCDAVRRVDPSIGRATVFRTLAVLERAGIVEQLSLQGERTGYLLCPTVGHHHHLVCQRCSAVSDLPEEAVAPFFASIEGDHGFCVDHASFSVYGVCAACTLPTRRRRQRSGAGASTPTRTR